MTSYSEKRRRTLWFNSMFLLYLSQSCAKSLGVVFQWR